MWSLQWISPPVFLLGSLCDTPRSCRSLSRRFKIKAAATACLSHFHKCFPCHFILRAFTLTSNFKNNNTGRILLSLEARLMLGDQSRLFLSCAISDFTELHWQSGLVLSTGKESALEQHEYVRDQQGWKTIHHWNKYCKGGTNPGKS